MDEHPDIYDKPLRPPVETLKHHKEHGGRHPNLLQVGDNAEHASRWFSLQEATRDMLGTAVPKTPESLAALMKQLFSELDKRGIQTALESAFAMQSSSGTDGVFIVAQDIKPAEQPLEIIERAAFARALHDVWQKLVEYWIEKAASNEPFLWDIFGLRQFVWGRSENDAENRLYLVDVDPRIATTRLRIRDALGGLALEVRQQEHMNKDLQDIDFSGLEKKVTDALAHVKRK